MLLISFSKWTSFYKPILLWSPFKDSPSSVTLRTNKQSLFLKELQRPKSFYMSEKKKSWFVMVISNCMVSKIKYSWVYRMQKVTCATGYSWIRGTLRMARLRIKLISNFHSRITKFIIYVITSFEKNIK